MFNAVPTLKVQILALVAGIVVIPAIQLLTSVLLKRQSLFGSAVSSSCFILMLSSPSQEWREPLLVFRGLAFVFFLGGLTVLVPELVGALAREKRRLPTTGATALVVVSSWLATLAIADALIWSVERQNRLHWNPQLREYIERLVDRCRVETKFDEINRSVMSAAGAKQTEELLKSIQDRLDSIGPQSAIPCAEIVAMVGVRSLDDGTLHGLWYNLVFRDTDLPSFYEPGYLPATTLVNTYSSTYRLSRMSP